MLHLLSEIKSTNAKHLRPTPTVVRTRDGKITVERADLLTKEGHENAVSVAKEAQENAENLLVAMKETNTGYLYRYMDDSWVRCNPNLSVTSLDPSKHLHAITFNVWFAEHQWERRQDELVKLIFNNRGNNVKNEGKNKNEESTNKEFNQPPEIILLQEVTVRFLQRLQNNTMIQQTYTMSDHGCGRTFIGGYGNVILVRNDLSLPKFMTVKFPSQMGRRGMFVQWDNLAISTVHLESLNASHCRLQQLELLFNALPDNCCIGGDFNIAGNGQYKEENDHFDMLCSKHNFQDASRDLGSTYDTEKNQMIQRVTGQPDDVARYDRILCRNITCDKMQLLGTTNFSNDVSNGNKEDEKLYISDHWGISWMIKLQETEQNEKQ